MRNSVANFFMNKTRYAVGRDRSRVGAIGSIRSKRTALRSLVAPALLIAISPVNLQAQNQVIEEIVVSAQKREQSLQDVPVAITTFDTEQIDRQNIISAVDLDALAPGLTVA